jgi:phage-related minor tail protein
MAQVIGFQIVIDGLGKTVETATELKRAIADVNAELKKTTDVQEIKKLEAKLVDLKAAQMEVNKVVKEQIKSRNEEITATDKANGAYRKLSKELNDQRNRYKDLAAAQQDNTQEAKDLLVSIGKLDRELKGIDATVGQFQRNVGGYTEALGQFFPKLSGTLGQVTGAIGGMQNGFASLNKASGALNVGLGTVGIALTAFQAISEIVGGLIEAARATKELSAQVTNFTQITGEELTQVVASSQAIAVTYGKNVDDIVVAANSASKALGISFAQALDVVEIGFRKGADAQGQFLDGLKEYSVQFRDAGLSAEDFLRVSIASANEGIFSDKGLDAVKEFGLRIQEQTKGSKDALTNAFGKEFTDELFTNINNGSVTSGQAFGLVTDKITETGIAGSQLQTVIADVFGGPGEDIGKDFLITLGDVLQSTDDVTLSSNLYQKQQEELFRVNEQLKISEVAYNQTLATTGVEFEIATAKGKLFLNGVLSGILNYFEQVPNRLNAYKKAFAEFTKPEGSILSFFKVFNQQIKDGNKEINLINKEALKEQERIAKEQAAALLGTQEGLEQKLSEKRKQRKVVLFGSADYKKLSEEIKGIESELNKFKPEVPARNLGGKLGKEAAKETVKAFTEGSLAALENQRSELQSAFSNAVVGSGTQKELAVKLNAINNQIKSAVEQQNQILADATRGNLLNNLKNAEQLATLPLTTKPPELLKKEVEDIQKVFKEVTKNADDFRDEQRKKEEEDLEERAKRIETYLQTASLVTDFFSTVQQARFKKDADQLNEQIELTEENIATLEAKAEKASGLKKRRLEKEIVQEKALLDARNKEAEALQLKAAKAEKKIAIMQSIIQGALAVNRALAVPPGPPFTIGSAITAGVFAGIQTATIIAQPLAEGGVVTGQRVNQKQNIPTRSNGDNVLAYVKRGEVVLNQRQQSLLGGSPTFRKLGIKGFAEGGMVPPINPTIQGMSLQGNMNEFLQVMEAKTDAINNRIDRLQAYVVSEDIARDLAEGNKLKINATL